MLKIIEKELKIPKQKKKVGKAVIFLLGYSEFYLKFLEWLFFPSSFFTYFCSYTT